MREGWDDILDAFLVESNAVLVAMEDALLSSGADAANGRAVSELLQDVQGLRDYAAQLGFAKLAALAMSGEALLTASDGVAVPLSPQVSEALLDMVDAARDVLMHIEDSGEEGAADYADLMRRLARLKDGSGDEGSVVRSPLGGSMVGKERLNNEPA